MPALRGYPPTQVYVAKRDGAKNIFKQYLDSQGGELRVRALVGCSLRAVKAATEGVRPLPPLPLPPPALLLPLRRRRQLQKSKNGMLLHVPAPLGTSAALLLS